MTDFSAYDALLLRISFGIAAFIFGLVLLILLLILGHGQRDNNSKFRTLVIIVLVGNLISIADNALRGSDFILVPLPIKALVYLVALIFNVFLTYCVSLYFKTFVRDEEGGGALMKRINRSIVIISCVMAVVLYIHALSLFRQGVTDVAIPGIGRIVIGYAVEIYFLIYSMVIVIRYRESFGNRAFITAIGAYVVIITAIVMQFVQTRGILLNYFGAVIGMYIFYIGVEIPDYRNLKKSLDELSKAKERADDANRAKSVFLANMSHEIRTPMNAILGFDEMIIRETKNPEVKGYALDIKYAGDNLLNIINDILDFSKIESGKMELLNVKYEFSSLLYDVVNVIQMKAEEKELNLIIDVAPDLPSWMIGDDVRLRQVLINLLNNAVKYTEKGSVTLHVDGKKHGDEADIRFCVEDTGIGMKPEDIDKLYERFSRIEENRNRNIEGTGLGMSITVKLLSMMNTKLDVNSVYGQGSSFSFVLRQKVWDFTPIGSISDRIEDSREKKIYHSRLYAPEAEILLVDDNAVNRKMVRSLLKHSKILIDEAAGGMECLKKVEEKHYDIVLLDHMMPDLDGVETFHRMQAMTHNRCKDVPVIILTANAVIGAKENYLQEGFTDYLSKPVRSDKLENMLLQYLPKELIKEMPSYPDETMVTSDEKTEAAFPEIEGIDWDYAKNLVGDAGILHDTAQSFYDSMERESKRLRSIYSELKEDDGEENLRLYRVQVHAMKSSSLMIGAILVSALAKKLEFAARDKQMDIIHRFTDMFLEEWDELFVRMTEYFPGGEAETELKPFSSEEVLSCAKQINDAMEEMDVDRADELVQKLKAYSYEADTKTLMEDLFLAVENLDVEKTRETVNKIMGGAVIHG